MSGRLTFYPLPYPYRRGRLKVSELHEIYFEECGNPAGKPALVLHGGPGGGISPYLKQLHDPARYRIIVFDQRGCGQSTPHGELRENTTWDLVGDIEILRQHLTIERWQVTGGSWGSTLALTYALTHRTRVTELILRGIFTARKQEIDWFYQYGASEIFPEAWDEFLAPIPAEERNSLVGAYYKRLTGTNKAEQIRCAKAWSQWEGATMSFKPDPARVANFGNEHFAWAFGRIECHYFWHGAFFESEGYLLSQSSKLAGLPGGIVQGRYDVVTPLRSAHDLHKTWPDAQYSIVGDAGHVGSEPGTVDALIRLTRLFGGD